MRTLTPTIRLRHPFGTHVAIAQAAGLYLLGTTTLFRRRQPSVTREDAFRDLFQQLAALYEGAARMKPEWYATWQDRRSDALPDKYDIGSDLAVEGAQDMRFAIRLLQQNRWKSAVSPIFAVVEETAWNEFQEVASRTSSALATLSEGHADRLYQDEQDWVNAAIEQLDDATRLRRRNERDDVEMSRRVAEGVYQPVYAAIHLSDRLLERMRQEAAQQR